MDQDIRAAPYTITDSMTYSILTKLLYSLRENHGLCDPNGSRIQAVVPGAGRKIRVCGEFARVAFLFVAVLRAAIHAHPPFYCKVVDLAALIQTLQRP